MLKRFDLHNFFNKLFTLLGLIVVLCCFQAEAKPEEEDIEDWETKSVVEKKSIEQNLIESDILISNMFDNLAHGLDVFLAGKKRTDKVNKTRVVLENTTYSSEGGQRKNSTNLDVNLRLPNLEDYWQLKFTSYDENEDKRELQNRYLRKAPREKNYGASVGIFKKLGKVRTSFQPRIELKDPLKISHTLRFESRAEFKKVEVNPKLELFASPDKGTGVFTGLNFSTKLNKDFSLSMVNGVEYEDRQNKMSTSDGFVLGQRITDRSSMSYAIIFDCNNRETYHLENYSVSAGWSHALYKNVLHYQLVPHWDFVKARSFKGIVGIVFNVGLIF